MKDFKRSEVGVEPVNLAFEPGDLRVSHRQPRASRPLLRQTEVGLDVEKIVLNAGKRDIERLVTGRMQPHQADDCVDFIQRAIGLNAKVVLLAPRPRSKGRRAVVTCPGIDPVEHDHIDLA